LTRNVVRFGRERIGMVLATPTPVQRQALELLGATAAT
jgi:hypothetical protein